MKAALSLPRQARAFTLVELLLATTVTAVLMVVCVSTLDAVQRSVKGVRGKTEQFREARQAFELITKTLSQATLNPYWDYYYSSSGGNQPPVGAVVPPDAYVRQSELQFQLGAADTLLGGQTTPATHPGHGMFFQAPLGLTEGQGRLGSLLNARGFYIQFGDDAADRPPFLVEQPIPLRQRYRLMEYRPPAERTGRVVGNAIYQRPADWFRQDLAAASRVVADNIVLLVLSPQVPEQVARATKKTATWIAPQYAYNSLDVDNATPALEKVSISADGVVRQGTQHLLPPVVVVTMVALDEVSAAKWAERNANQPVDLLKEANAPFTRAAAYAEDLLALETWLEGQKLNHETFSTAVVLRNARWDTRTF